MPNSFDSGKCSYGGGELGYDVQTMSTSQGCGKKESDQKKILLLLRTGLQQNLTKEQIAHNVERLPIKKNPI